MTADKYKNHNWPLEERVQSIESDVREIKGMVSGIYNRFGDLVDTAEATYKTVSYHPEEPAGISDDEWDFLDEEE